MSTALEEICVYVRVYGGGCQLMSFVNSNPTMSLGKVYGLIRGDRARGLQGLEDYEFVHLFHMAPSTSAARLSFNQHGRHAAWG